MAKPFVVMRTQPVAGGLGTWAIPNTLQRLEETHGASHGVKCIVVDAEDEDGLLRSVKEHRPQIIMCTYAKLTRRVIEAAMPDLVAIVKSGVRAIRLDPPATACLC